MNTKNTSMRKEELEILLKKYYEGVSTPGEEEKLREYFSSQNIPAGFEAEKAMFGFFGEAAAPEPSADFEDRILNGIDVSLEKRNRRIIYFVSAVAALLLLLISLVFIVKSQSSPVDTFDDPQLAYAETMKILYSISVQLNKGKEALEPVSKMKDIDLQGLRVFNQSMKTLDKEMNNLKPLNDAIELTGTSDKNKNN